MSRLATAAFFALVFTVLAVDYGKASAEFYQPHRIVECRR